MRISDFSILDNLRDLFTLWLRDSFCQISIFEIEVSVGRTMSLSVFLNIDLRMPCFGQKMMSFF